MDRREKIWKMMELQGTIESVREEINRLRYPLGLASGVEFIPFDNNDEKTILEQMSKIFDEWWTSEEELDQAIAFMDSPAGVKSRDPTKEFNKKLLALFGSFLKEKVDKFNLERKVQQLTKLAPGSKNIH